MQLVGSGAPQGPFSVGNPNDWPFSANDHEKSAVVGKRSPPSPKRGSAILGMFSRNVCCMADVRLATLVTVKVGPVGIRTPPLP